MKKYVLLFCLIFILAGCGDSSDFQKSDYRQITMDESMNLMQGVRLSCIRIPSLQCSVTGSDLCSRMER